MPLYDVSLGEEETCARIAEESMVAALSLELGSCLVRFRSCNLFIAGNDYYLHHEGFELLRVYLIYGFSIGFILFIVLWNIAHAVFLQLLPCKDTPCDGVEVQ